MAQLPARMLEDDRIVRAFTAMAAKHASPAAQQRVTAMSCEGRQFTRRGLPKRRGPGIMAKELHIRTYRMQLNKPDRLPLVRQLAVGALAPPRGGGSRISASAQTPTGVP